MMWSLYYGGASVMMWSLYYDGVCYSGVCITFESIMMLSLCGIYITVKSNVMWSLCFHGVNCNGNLCGVSITYCDVEFLWSIYYGEVCYDVESLWSLVS